LKLKNQISEDGRIENVWEDLKTPLKVFASIASCVVNMHHDILLIKKQDIIPILNSCNLPVRIKSIMDLLTSILAKLNEALSYNPSSA